MEPIILTDTARALSPWYSEQLEAGRILIFPHGPLQLPDEDYRFLLGQQQTEAPYHKNIAYRPRENVVTGAARATARKRLGQVLNNYCSQAAALVARLLPRYAKAWQLDFTSFRPFAEENRTRSLHARNDLLHVDAFPTRPTHGDRILRLFTNLNREQPRVWLTSENFEALVGRFAQEARLLEQAHRSCSPLRQAFARFAGFVRLRQFTASPYDFLMRHFHNFLKENREFQENCPKTRIEFPPKSSWIVFTDTASHAVLAGQFALEQTFIVPRRALVHPEGAPVSILERLTGVSLTWNNSMNGGE